MKPLKATEELEHEHRVIEQVVAAMAVLEEKLQSACRAVIIQNLHGLWWAPERFHFALGRLSLNRAV